MATPKRQFKRGVPYLITEKLQQQWLDSRTLRQKLIADLITNLDRTDVALIGFFIAGNHVHLIVAQRHGDGCNPTKGIAALVRNVFSPLSRTINARCDPPDSGHRTKKRYHHFELPDHEALLAGLAYVHGQVEHHRLPGLEDLPDRRSWDALVHGLDDGVVTDVLPLGLSGDALRELLEQTIERACTREREPDPPPQVWRGALREALDDCARCGAIRPDQLETLRGMGAAPTLARRESGAHRHRREQRRVQGRIGKHFVLKQVLDEAGLVCAYRALRGYASRDKSGRERVSWREEAVIDARPRPEPGPSG